MVLNNDALKGLSQLESQSVDCIITSPPYFQLRDYHIDGQIGLETSPKEYIDKLVAVFDEAKRVLKDTGTLWIVISDTYAGDKQGKTDEKLAYIPKQMINKKPGNIPRKSLMMIPSRLAIEMIDHGWVLRNKIIWHKPNAMPSSVKDRFTVDYEEVFFFTKSKTYFFNQPKEKMKTLDSGTVRGSKAALKVLNKGLRILNEYNRTISDSKQSQGGRSDYTGFNERYVHPENLMRNKRTVWSISTESSSIEHFAMFPRELVETMMEAGCPKNGVVLDPFLGSGTTCIIAKQTGRSYVGIELNPEYAKIAEKRLSEISTVQLSIF